MVQKIGFLAFFSIFDAREAYYRGIVVDPGMIIHIVFPSDWFISIYLVLLIMHISHKSKCAEICNTFKG